MTSTGATCATCPLSLPCFSGHLDHHGVGLCFHCGCVVMFTAGIEHPNYFGVLVGRGEVGRHRCHNPLQFLDAVQKPIRRMENVNGFPGGIVEFNPPLLLPDASELQVTCVACTIMREREEQRERPLLFVAKKYYTGMII